MNCQSLATHTLWTENDRNGGYKFNWTEWKNLLPLPIEIPFHPIRYADQNHQHTL